MIGVCIKYFHENYGGMLQAFATTKVLEEREIDYELIQYQKKKNIGFLVKSVPRLFNSVLLNDKVEAFKKKRGLKKHPEFAKQDEIRMRAFERFKKEKFVKQSEVYYGYDKLCSGAKKYDMVLVGSDQLWSPAGLPTNYYNLMFVPDEVPKISYASSFGVKNIPWYQKRRTKKFLERIEFISMRENRGGEIVKELTGREAPTVLDPVFLFDQNGWADLIPYQKEIEEPYIFAYFLGNNPEHRKAVKKLAEHLEYKIVTLRHLDQYVESDEEFGDFAPYDVAPDRFLNLLRGASYVCTDSFHGTCFSIINEKKFMVFNRYDETYKNSKNSRIDTLCHNLSLEDRRFNGKNVKDILKEIDYSSVNEKLLQLRKEANEYLDRALGTIE